MKQPVIVTGGAGFIGSHVAKELLAMGHKVIILDDLSGGFLKNIPPEAGFIKASVTDKTLMNQIFDDYKPDYVYHLAAYAAEGLSHHIRSFNYTNNVVGSANIINACINHNVKCLVFTSSIAVYGHQPPPFKESSTPTPADPYAIAKYAVEMDLKAAKEYHGLNSIIFRPYNVYGPHQNIADPYRNVVGIFLRQALAGQPLTIFGDGTQTRAFSYIDDVAPVIAHSIGYSPAYNGVFNVGPVIAHSIGYSPAYNGVFNVGGETHYTILELVDAVRWALGIPVEVVHLAPRKEVHAAYSDRTKLEAVFNTDMPASLKDGLSKMAEWVRNSCPLQPTPSPRVEVHNNLPPSWKNLQ